MDDLLTQLKTLAQTCRDSEDFRKRARERFGIEALVGLLGSELREAEAFFQQVRRDPAAEGALELHPQAARLREECRDLAAELANLVVQHDSLVTELIPSLEAEYLTKLGPGRTKLLELQLENRRLQRRIEAIQACLNRGRVPDLERIDQALEEELRSWIEEVTRLRREVEKARQMLSEPIPYTELRQLRSLYRELVKLLHPDLNPATPERARLWLQVQQAWQEGDIQGLELLADLARRLEGRASWEETSALDRLTAERDRLKGHVQRIATRLQELRNSFPCDHQHLLSDPVWLEEQDRQTRKALELELRSREALQARLRLLLEESCV
ncbi:MAG: hypothetical protein GX934_08805 [Burkholderiales bacterium]|nr:hypothetical protein [Burkholderiales bacterium]